MIMVREASVRSIYTAVEDVRMTVTDDDFTFNVNETDDQLDSIIEEYMDFLSNIDCSRDSLAFGNLSYDSS